MPVCLHVCLFACLYACLIICLFCCLYAFQNLSDLLHPMSVYRLHIYLYACLPIYQPVRISVCVPACSLICQSVCIPHPFPTKPHHQDSDNSFLFHKAHDHVYLLSQHVERGTTTPPTLQPIHHRQCHSAT